MKLSYQQNEALDRLSTWLRQSFDESPIFRLFGWAGTGKTSIAKYLTDSCHNPMYCAFTGKAVDVLVQKGCPAQTIHKLIYKPKEKSKQRLQELEAKLASIDKNNLEEIEKIEKQIAFEHKNLASPNFILNPDSPIKECDILVVDECSMVTRKMAMDLLWFGKKILVLGDPAQLPPVGGTGYFINAEPDFMLTEIHRQAKDNPIIQLATRIRNQEQIFPDNKLVFDWNDIDSKEALNYDQIIVGLNDTRRAMNFRIRDLLGRTSELPEEKDRVVCLRNDADTGLLNGAIWEVESCYNIAGETVDLLLRNSQQECLAVEAHKHYFIAHDNSKLPYWIAKEAQEFDWGYTLTCHKSQGSQWDSVIVFDESDIFREANFKWKYTAVTRAAKELKFMVRT